MTTDAKIGLLLALVFIVAITFVINGLPDFLNKKDKNDVTVSYIGQSSRPQEPGIVDRTSREAAAVLNRTPAKTIYTAPSAAEQSPTAANTNTPTATTSYPAILPAASEAVKSTNQTDQQTTVMVTTQPQTSLTSTGVIPAVKEAPKEVVLKAGEKLYEVTDGDSLVTIAQKVYGQKAGNKYANVVKIYEANKGTMKSIDELHVGQKIIIPSLTQKEQALVGSGLFERAADDSKSAADTKKTADTKSAAATKKSSDTKSADTPAPKETKYREYVVKENDNLWKIAARVLGDGNRYKEIAELNKNINPDNLVVGTKIKLPAK